jgi:hypothetical protein
MAKRAGLLAKGGVWIQYPERMLKLRARGFCLRDAFPDALKGIKPREEVEDYIDADYKVTDDKNLSRTELLKKDFLNKKGVTNDAIYGSAPISENKMDITETEDSEVQLSMDKTGTEEAEMHLEIKKLITEKCFTEERLSNALKYYEVTSIEELNYDSSQHFIKQLIKG